MEPKTQQVNLLPLFFNFWREGIRTFTIIFITLVMAYQILAWIGKHLQ